MTMVNQGLDARGLVTAGPLEFPSGITTNPMLDWWFGWQATPTQVAAVGNLGVQGGIGVTPSGAGAPIAAFEGLAGWMPMMRCGAAINSTFGWTGVGAPSAFWRVKYQPFWRVYIRTGPSLAGQRILIGYGANNFQQNDFVAAAANGCGIRFSTSSGDPGFVGVTKTTAGVVTVTDLALMPVVNTEYVVTLKVSSTTITYTVQLTGSNSKVERTVVSPFTAANATMGGEILVGGLTTENVAKDFGCCRAFFYYRNMNTIQIDD